MRLKTGWYKPKNGYIGKYAAIKHESTGELTLAGEYGEIWVHNATHCRAIVTSVRVAKKLGLSPEVAGDECLATFPNEDLDKWVKALKVRRNRVTMVERANNYGNF